MPSPRHTALGPGAAATALPALALALTTALLCVGCGPKEQGSPTARALLHGTKGTPIFAADLAPAVRLAHRFANSYAHSVYRRRPSRPPGATAALTARLAQAAGRVPPSRRHLRPRALAIDLTPRSAAILLGSIRIGDGHSPIFSVGFTLKKRKAGWRVVAASPPG